MKFAFCIVLTSHRDYWQKTLWGVKVVVIALTQGVIILAVRIRSCMQTVVKYHQLPRSIEFFIPDSVAVCRTSDRQNVTCDCRLQEELFIKSQQAASERTFVNKGHWFSLTQKVCLYAHLLMILRKLCMKEHDKQFNSAPILINSAPEITSQ